MSAPRPVTLLIGSYTNDHESLAYYNGAATLGGVQVATLNTTNGALTAVHQPVAAGTNPTYAAFDRNTSTAYFTNENLSEGCVKAFRLNHDRSLELINSMPVDGVHPAFVAFCPSTRAVLCANYVSGDVSVFGTTEEGALQPPRTTSLPRQGLQFPGPVAERQDAPHAHCLVPVPDSGGVALCADLGADRLYAIRILDGTVLSYSKLPAGCGPRHVALQHGLQHSHSFAYVSTELANTIVAVPIHCELSLLHKANGVLPSFALDAPCASLSVLPIDYGGPPTTASHIELSECGKFAFIANRVGVGLDGNCSSAVEALVEGAISVVGLTPRSETHLTLLHYVPIGGVIPRSFCLVDGWLVVAAQESSCVRSFSISTTGELVAVDQLQLPSPGCVVVAR